MTFLEPIEHHRMLIFFQRYWTFISPGVISGMACLTNFLEQKALTEVNIGQFNKKDKKNQDIIKTDQTSKNHTFF